jgi:hypothetical protein
VDLGFGGKVADLYHKYRHDIVPIRQAGQRAGQLDLRPALLGVPADRLVAPRLVFLPVGGQEQPGRLPLPPPPGLAHAGLGEAAALAQQRRRRGSGRDLQWSHTSLLYSAERGNLDNKFFEITEDEANRIVERIRATVTGTGTG